MGHQALRAGADARSVGVLVERGGAEPGPVFFALADETRRRIVERLHDGSHLTPSSLAAELPVTRQAISKHLAVLHAAGLVTRARTGRETRYRFQAQPLADAAAWIAAVGGAWDARLARLDDVLQRQREATSGPRR